jgi:hypothetical protein
MTDYDEGYVIAATAHMYASASAIEMIQSSMTLPLLTSVVNNVLALGIDPIRAGIEHGKGRRLLDRLALRAIQPHLIVEVWGTDENYLSHVAPDS